MLSEPGRAPPSRGHLSTKKADIVKAAIARGPGSEGRSRIYNIIQHRRVEKVLATGGCGTREGEGEGNSRKVDEK